MAQRRMISRTISTSKKVNRLSDKSALLYTWIIPQTDDFGHMDGEAAAVKAIVVPMRKFSIADVEKSIVEMESVGLVKRYCVNGEKYLEICNFGTFQTFKNDRMKQKLYPFPDGSSMESCGIQEVPTEPAREGNLSKENIREEKPHRSISFLSFVPSQDLQELSTKYKISATGIRAKATDLKLYCESKGRTYKNYRAFLENALRKDAPQLREKFPLPRPQRIETPEPPETPAQRASREKKMGEIRDSLRGVAKAKTIS